MPEIDFEKEENKQLLKNLFAYTRGLYNQLFKHDRNWKGKTFEDYVHDAIVRHLLDEDSYDVRRGSLEYHLKYNVIRRSLTNDLPPAVKKEYLKFRKMTEEERELSAQTTAIESVAIEPDELSILSQIANSIDSAALFARIELEINGDSVVEQIYLAVVYDTYEFSERVEICDDFKISLKDFDNGKRRFMTILRRVFKNLGIKA